MANQLDQFGIKMIYPTRAGRREWFLSDSPMEDSRSSGDLEDDIAGGDSTNGFFVGDNGQVRLGVAADNANPDPSNENLNHSTAKGRGYAFSTDDWDMHGIEMTARIKCTDHDSEDSRFIMKGPTGSHHSNSTDCSGTAYNIRFFLPDTGSRAGMTQFSKEQWHVHYISRPDNPVPTGQGQIFNQWIVCKFIMYIVKAPDGVTEHVKLEGWLNKNNDGVTFVKILETVDAGGWGDSATTCDAEVDDEIMTWSSARMLFRWDGPAILFKDLSVREVDPFGTITEPEQPPTTGTVSRDWTLKYNLITFPQNACGITQEDALVEFYNVTGTSQSNLHRDRYRACEFANGSGSDLIGKKPKRVIVKLSKTNNPPSGDVTVVLRKGSDDSVAVTYAYTGGPNLNATALTTSSVEYTFEDLDANYSIQNGDRICVEYSSNTVDTSNEVNVYRNTADPFDGSSTCAIKFESGGPPPVGYSAADTTRDYAWRIAE